MTGKMKIVDEYEKGEFSDRFVSMLSEILLND